MFVPQWVLTFLITLFVLVLVIVVVLILIVIFHIKGVVMPNPNSYDTREAFMEACVPMRIEEGDDQDRAVAVCSSMWDNKSEVFKGAIFKHE